MFLALVVKPSTLSRCTTCNTQSPRNWKMNSELHESGSKSWAPSAVSHPFPQNCWPMRFRLQSWETPTRSQTNRVPSLLYAYPTFVAASGTPYCLINSTGNRALSLVNLIGVLSRATSLCHLRVNLDRLEVLEALQGFGQVVSLENLRQTGVQLLPWRCRIRG